MKNRQCVIMNDLQEMLRSCSGAGPGRLEDVMGILQNFNDIRIAIEFKCGECCKTVSNGRFIFPIPVGETVLILLFPEGSDELYLKECCCGKVVKKELEFIVIPFDKISSFEFYEESCYTPGVLGDSK